MISYTKKDFKLLQDEAIIKSIPVRNRTGQELLFPWLHEASMTSSRQSQTDCISLVTTKSQSRHLLTRRHHFGGLGNTERFMFKCLSFKNWNQYTELMNKSNALLAVMWICIHSLLFKGSGMAFFMKHLDISVFVWTLSVSLMHLRPWLVVGSFWACAGPAPFQDPRLVQEPQEAVSHDLGGMTFAALWL